jgi:hypothetical protein
MTDLTDFHRSAVTCHFRVLFPFIIKLRLSGKYMFLQRASMTSCLNNAFYRELNK